MANQNDQLPSVFGDRAGLFSLAPLRKQIDQLFESFGTDFPSFGPEVGFLPSADFHDSDKEVTIRIELPGVDLKDIKINATDRTIEVSGEKKTETEKKDGGRFTSERSFGSFERSFTLPYAIDPAKVDARFEKGVLTLKITKPTEAQTQTRRIAIHG